MKLLRRIAVYPMVAALALLACQGASDDAFVVEIDDGGVRLAELRGAIEARLEQEDAAYRGEILGEELERLVNEKLAARRARSLGIEIEDDELEAWLRRLHGPEYKTRDEAYRESVRAKLAADRAAIIDLADQVEVPEEAVLEYFEAHRDEFRLPPRIQIRQIVVQDPPHAQALIDQLNGGADFSDLARQHSVAPEAAQGGLLPPFAKGEMPEVFDRAFSLQVDEISDTVESPYGFHVFQLVARFPPQEPELEDVHSRIAADLQTQRLAELRRGWLRDLRKRSRIQVNERLLETLR